jgi:peroxiredoxin
MRSTNDLRAVGAVLTLSAALGAGALYAAPKVVRPPAPAPKPAAQSPAQKAWQELIPTLQQKLKNATDRDKAAADVVTDLQGFAQKYPNDPVSDQARLAAGQIQLELLAQPAAAIDSFHAVADHPVDKKLQPVGQLFLARAQSAAGKPDEAQKLFDALSKSADPGIKQAAKQGIAELALSPGRKPPAFTVNDLDGKPQSPDRFQGQVLLIDFWATWCGPCRGELPNVKSVYDKFHDKGFAILGVSLDEDKDALQKFVKEQNMAWPQLFDGKGWKNEIAQLYRVNAIPKTLLLDRQGVIRHVNLRGPALEKAVAELVAAAPPTGTEPEKKDAGG